MTIKSVSGELTLQLDGKSISHKIMLFGPALILTKESLQPVNGGDNP